VFRDGQELHLKFSRALSTGDTFEDRILDVDEDIFFIWALHDEVPSNVDSFSRHLARDSIEVDLDASNVVSSTSTNTATPSSVPSAAASTSGSNPTPSSVPSAAASTSGSTHSNVPSTTSTRSSEASQDDDDSTTLASLPVTSFDSTLTSFDTTLTTESTTTSFDISQDSSSPEGSSSNSSGKLIVGAKVLILAFLLAMLV